MSRWGLRILGIVMLIFFLILLANLQRQLVELQRAREGAPATDTR
ncbi:MAG: hypothetical protein ACXVIJ_10885 [Thermoanaerobaculia bacterium]